MAETQAELEAQLAQVRAHKALPKVQTVADSSTTARDMEELDALETQILARLAALTSTPSSPQRPRIFFGYAAGKGT